MTVLLKAAALYSPPISVKYSYGSCPISAPAFSFFNAAHSNTKRCSSSVAPACPDTYNGFGRDFQGATCRCFDSELERSISKCQLTSRYLSGLNKAPQTLRTVPNVWTRAAKL